MIKNKKMLKLCACIFSTSLILSSTLVITNNNVFSRKKNNIVNNIIGIELFQVRLFTKQLNIH